MMIAYVPDWGRVLILIPRVFPVQNKRDENNACVVRC